ncbi:MAG: fibronectin type III domain-containing protein [Candidatus Nanopelagicales bacterium]
MALAVVTAFALPGFEPSQATPTATPRPILPANDATVEQPEFQWTAVPQASGYRLELALDHRFASVWRTITSSANRYIPTAAMPAGSFWWRVRALYANGVQSPYSTPRAFARRWTVADGNGSRSQEIARPDQVRVEDFDPGVEGVQAPVNAIKIWWEPVADASEYEVQFDGDTVCTTTHTVLTPNAAGNEAESGSDDGATGGGESCTLETAELGSHWVRVRAVDITTTDQPIYSLWSDQARAPDEMPPAPTMFTLTTAWVGSGEIAPAKQTHPGNGDLSVDAPVLEWMPVATAPEYRVVIARDRDFTNVIGDWRTTNTRMIPTGSLWDHTAMRSYYWMVLPCFELEGAKCLNESQAVNRPGKFRSFRKQTLEMTPRTSSRDDTPWTTFRWHSFSHSVGVKSSATRSVPGLKWYEVQYRAQGTRSWAGAVTSTTDVTSWVSEALPFGMRLLWRVRAVDGTGEPHAWSEVFTTNTPIAVPLAPARLSAARKGLRLTLTWTAASARFFPVTSYTVWYSANGNRWRSLGTTGGTSMRLKIGSQRKFWMRVSAHNTAGEGRPSAAARIR